MADGSASVAHGLTSVMVTVFGAREARSRAATQHDRATLNVNVDVPAFSGATLGGSKRNRNDKLSQCLLYGMMRMIIEINRSKGEYWNSQRT